MRQLSASLRVVFAACLLCTALVAMAVVAGVGTGPSRRSRPLSRRTHHHRRECARHRERRVHRQGNRIAWVGVLGDAKPPAGATRVDLAGKTVMPAIIDTHTHLSRERDALVADLERRAYLGRRRRDEPGTGHGRRCLSDPRPDDPERRTLSHRRPRHHDARTGPHGQSRTGSRASSEARKAVQELAARKVDFVKIWVDDRDGKYKKLTPELYGADHRGGAQARAPRHRAHLHARGRQRAAARRPRRVCARRARPGHRRRVRGADQASVRRSSLVPNLPDRGVATDLSWLRGGVPAAELQKLQAAATDRPEAQKTFAIQARNLARLNKEGVRIALGTDGNTPWGPHVEMADMVACGHDTGAGDRRRHAQLARSCCD